MKKKLLTALLLATISISMCACTEAETGGSKNVIQNITPSGDTGPNSGNEQSDPEKTEPESNLPENATVGQVVTGEKWSIALLYAKEYDSIDAEYYSDKPSEGNKFLALFFDVKNISAKNDYFNSLYFEGYADDYSVSSEITMNKPDGMDTIGGNVDSGKMSKGVIIYEVPADWKKFEISYKDGVWTTHKHATFVVNKEDLSANDYVYTASVYPEYTLDPSKKTEAGTEIKGKEWSISLIDYKKYSSVGDVLTQKPDDGKEFVVFFLEASNISSSDDYFNTLYFRFYVDGYLSPQNALLSDIDGYSGISGNVAAGKKIKGYVAVQAPIGWKSIELIYDDGTFIENKVAEFAVENK